MSFQSLKKDLLLQVAEDFAVDLEEEPTKAQIVAALADEGVTWEIYKKAFPDELEQEDAVVLEDGDEVVVVASAKEKYTAPVKKTLIKMTRPNGTYEVRGHKFTKAHPFLPVSDEDANYILEHLEGFKIATPREAEEYYS